MKKTALMEVVSKMFAGKDTEATKELKVEEVRAIEITPIKTAGVGPAGIWY